jgi:ribosomal protein L37AE/L43A
MSESRAPAQYCPYCGETNLWPHEESHGAWTCRDCRRVFAVRFVGLAGAGNTGGSVDAAPVTARSSGSEEVAR